MWWRCPLHKPFNGGEQRAHNKTGDRRANTLHTRTSSIASRIAGSDTSAMAVFNRKVTHFPISPGWSTYLKKTTCDFYRRDDTQSGPQHNLAPAITGKDTTCTSLWGEQPTALHLLPQPSFRSLLTHHCTMIDLFIQRKITSLSNWLGVCTRRSLSTCSEMTHNLGRCHRCRYFVPFTIKSKVTSEHFGSPFSLTMVAIAITGAHIVHTDWPFWKGVINVDRNGATARNRGQNGASIRRYVEW